MRRIASAIAPAGRKGEKDNINQMNKDYKNIFNICKPKGPTSFGIVAKVRQITGIKKVGHAGTLDPLASGVLVVGVGRDATRRLSEIAGEEKEYIADIKLGITSATDDEEGEKNIPEFPISNFQFQMNGKAISSKQIKKVLDSFVGIINQIPPQFSAVKINGRRAYKSARAGQKVELSARPVEIKDIEILKYKYPDLQIRVVCGKGTYIRALARDVGAALRVGGYLAGLERTRVGEFTSLKSITLEQLADLWRKKENKL